MGDLHAWALDEVPTKKSIELLEQLFLGYDNDFDKARIARDLAKYQFYSGDHRWTVSIEDSFALLRSARKDPESLIPDEMLTREEAATLSMSGYLTLLAGLETENSGAYAVASYQLHNARLLFKKTPGRSVRPDQYEINFAVAGAIADRYAHRPGRAVLALGRAALIASMSESRLARHQSPALSKEERKKARKHSLSKLAYAAKIVFMPGGDMHLERQSVREKVIETLDGETRATRQRRELDSDNR